MTPTEFLYLSGAVNRWGNGGHPECTEETITLFRPKYVAACLRLRAEDATEPHRAWAFRLADRIEAGEVRLEPPDRLRP